MEPGCKLRQSVVQEVSKGNNFLGLALSGLTFIDSAGLGAIIGGLRRVRSHEGDLLLVGLNDELQKVFELCELDQIFNMKLRRELN